MPGQLRGDEFARCLLFAVRRVAEIRVDARVVVQDAACVGVGPKTLNIGVQGLEATMGRGESRGVVRFASDDLDVAR
jgi:hypothetical protein